MNEGDIVITPLAQSDRIVKNRPAVILRKLPPFDDLLVCGISTQLHQQVFGFDDLILPGDVDFVSSGLASGSLIRLGFLTGVPQRDIVGVIGAISAERHRKLLANLSDYLRPQIAPHT